MAPIEHWTYRTTDDIRQDLVTTVCRLGDAVMIVRSGRRAMKWNLAYYDTWAEMIELELIKQTMGRR
jgi:hypothetical protein